MKIEVLCKGIEGTFNFEIEGKLDEGGLMNGGAGWILFMDKNGIIHAFRIDEIICYRAIP